MMFIPAAVSAFASLQQGEAAQEAGDFNAAMADRSATSTLQQTGQSEATQRRSALRAAGDQAAAMGEAGVAGSSTSQAVQHQSSVDAELDALNIRYKGTLAAWGLRNQGAVAQMEGDSAAKNSQLLAGSKILGAVGDKYW